MKPPLFSRQILQTVGIIIFVSILAGCATATNPEAMTIQAPESGKYEPIAEPLFVVVDGGRETSSTGASQISNADLQSAIIDSIRQTGLFSQVVKIAPDSSYILQATIIDLEQPTMGFSMTVDLEIAWSLNRTSTEKPVWQDSHESTYTATAGAAFAGVTRLRIATEGAVKKNISWALDTISKLDGL